jgi:hypothetical protein
LREPGNCLLISDGAHTLRLRLLYAAACLLWAPFLRADRDPGITVGWISRSPSMDWVRDSPHPDRDGWPAPGQTVTWVAHVRNWNAVARTALPYRWRLDGAEIASGSADLPASSSTPIELAWSWTFDRHVLTFEIDGDGQNALSIFTDAISVGFYVEQSVYDFMRENQPKLGIDSFSFDDWAERHIARFNEMAALAVYPETPRGVLDRWRLDEIAVVPDGALPLVPLPNYGQMDGQPNESTHPNTADRAVDLEWGFPAKMLTSFTDLTTADDSNPFFLSGSLVHELGHARYLVDVYGWNVWTGESDGSQIAIKEGGKPVAGSPLMPLSGSYAHFTFEQGLMNQDYSFIDRYSAIVLNFIAGDRAIEGNSNDPDNEGSWLNDLPAENRLTILNSAGAPIPDASIRIYQATGVPGHFLTKFYDDVPDLNLRTDEHGQVLVGRCPFAADGRIVHHFGESNVTAIVRVESHGVVAYGFLESRLFNLAYWSGHSELADHELSVGLPVCFPVRPALIDPPAEAAVPDARVLLSWSGGGTHVGGYRIWASIDGRPPRLLAETDGHTKSLAIFVAGRVAWWVEVDPFDCPPSRSATGFFTAPAPPRRGPVAVPPAELIPAVTRPPH